MIEVSNLSKSFGQKVLFEDLSFTIQEGERVAVTGESGKGKTTLLRLLSGLERPDHGTISGFSQQDIAYAFQEPRLFPTLSVLENVLCVSQKKPVDRARAKQILSHMELDDLKKRPSELSGGMKQRVCLARALYANRSILFLDEPFTGLDVGRKERIRATILDFCRGRTLVLVSHDPSDVVAMTQRALSLA